ncbi:MAG: hypothetical protein ABH840_00965 [Nanoarchaeota archaeon]
MKKPNFKKWAKRKLKTIKDETDSFEVGSAYQNAAILSKELGKRYEKAGSIEKAKHMYAQAAQAYERLEDYDMAAKMYHKAGISSKTDDLKEELEKRKRSFLEHLSISSIILSFILGIFLISPNFTGNAVLNINRTTSNAAGILFFIIGFIALFLIFRRSHHSL